MSIYAPPLGRRCWAEIDLAALERNLHKIRSALPPGVSYVSVVKADAYGHGYQQTVTRLMQAGADLFAVANVTEARQIEEIGSGWPILILSPVLPDELSEIADHDWMVTVSSASEVDRLSRLARERGRPVQIHLKIDTGMGRLGIWYEQADALYHHIQQSPGVDLRGVFTHFSSADSDLDYTHLQRERMLQLIKRLDLQPSDKMMLHADNSAALSSFLNPGPFNAVRIGLLQFGIEPKTSAAIGHVRVEPVFSFHTRVSLVKRLPAGTPISYGGTVRLKANSRVALLAAGYADGIPFPGTGGGHVLIDGTHCPILGRVTMDQTVVDVSHLNNVNAGDPAVLIGHQQKQKISLEEFSLQGNTIPWESLTSITKRVDRIYRTAKL
ncbi:MAG: alanine racemase [Opitutales bacterium]|nr:alanine racemase [Opitutales bacterium]